MNSKEYNKYRKASKNLVKNIPGLNDMFEASFPKISKEEAKKQDEHEFVQNMLEWAIEDPKRCTKIRKKKFYKITGIRL